jgi:hypothetical protein
MVSPFLKLTSRELRALKSYCACASSTSDSAPREQRQLFYTSFSPLSNIRHVENKQSRETAITRDEARPIYTGATVSWTFLKYKKISCESVLGMRNGSSCESVLGMGNGSNSESVRGMGYGSRCEFVLGMGTDPAAIQLKKLNFISNCFCTCLPVSMF